MTFFVELNSNDRQPQPPPTGPAPVPPNTGTRVGPLLKARRLELGLKHKDITKEIKIKPEYLKAIEDEEFDLLPTPQYLRLFLRTYALHLGFDIQEIYSIFDTQEMPVKKPEKKEPRLEAPQPSPTPQSGMKAYIWAGAAGVVVLFLIVLWLFSPGKKAPPPSTSTQIGTADSVADTASQPAAVEVPVRPLSWRYHLQVRGLDSTWMVIQADSDTVFMGFIEADEVRSWSADSSFKFSLSHFDGVEAKINGCYLKPFRQWRGPVQAREVGGYNLDRYIDSTRLTRQVEDTGPL